MTQSGVTTPGVSLVVCTYNGMARLPESLQHIARQRVAPDLLWELVVVDNTSKDGSAEAARRIWKEAGASCIFASSPNPGQASSWRALPGSPPGTSTCASSTTTTGSAPTGAAFDILDDLVRRLNSDLALIDFVFMNDDGILRKSADCWY